MIVPLSKYKEYTIRKGKELHDTIKNIEIDFVVKKINIYKDKNLKVKLYFGGKEFKKSFDVAEEFGSPARDDLLIIAENNTQDELSLKIEILGHRQIRK